MSLPPITINNDSKYYPDQVARMMREYGRAVREAALEECAKVADDFHGDCVKPRKHLSPAGVEGYRGGAIVAENIAAAIRALKNA